MLTTASLSAVSYEHNLSNPAIRCGMTTSCCRMTKEYCDER